MKKCTKPIGWFLGIAFLIGSGPAWAQSAPAPWSLSGSDTLENIMKDAIAEAWAKGVVSTTNGQSSLQYVGGGSSTAASQMTANVQSIGPMSRNFSGSELTAARIAAGWAPTIRNIVALDAGVIVTKNTTARCKNLTLPLDADPTRAAANNPGAPFTFGSPGTGYTQILEVILSGIDGSGSVVACSDPRRIQAVQDFAACQGVTTIDHFYRRDDNSGTTDTFKEKLAVGRFCNGRARGVVGANNPTNKNLNNQDLDPIRRPCLQPGLMSDGVTRRRETTCTDMTTGLACRWSDGNANCTQGLVVALSEGDNSTTLADVTNTIADRVGADSTGATVGYAGREAVRRPGAPTAGPFVNTNGFSDALIRLDSYMLSRRLFVQWSPDNTDMGTTSLRSGGGAAQRAQEVQLWNYMTDPDGSASPDNAPGRCNVDPIVKRHGFITCLDECGDTPTGASNLCSKQPAGGYPTAASSLSNCTPNSSSGGPAWGYEQVSCSAGSICCSTGAACPASGFCPAVANLPENSACTADSDCASGLTCQDFLGLDTKTCG